MKNTKELFIRLYTETLYSNFIVPLRGSNYIQLLYGDFKEKLGFFFKQTRQLVWQGDTNGLGQISGRIRAVFQIIPHNAASKMSSSVLKCPQKTKVLRRNVEAKKCHQPVIGLSSEKYHQMTTEIPPELKVIDESKVGVDRCKSVQFLTTPGIKMSANGCNWVQKIGSIRIKSDQKTRVKCYQMRPKNRATKGD